MAKREYTTKQLIVPAKYFLSLIAEDETVQYPITISTFGKHDSGCYSIHSPKELIELTMSKSVYECSVFRAARHDGKFYVDIKKDTGLLVDKTVLPYRGHMSTLMYGDVRELYETQYCVM